MKKRYLSLWFKTLSIDWHIRHSPELADSPFTLTFDERGKTYIAAASEVAKSHGICAGMTLADARILCSGVAAIDDKPELPEKILNIIADWITQYTPLVSIDMPDGLILDISGCTHLFNGEQEYLKGIVRRLRNMGYAVRGGIADTIGAAWANARYGQKTPIFSNNSHKSYLENLPIAALRVPNDIVEKLKGLGLVRIGQLYTIPAASLNRRFGNSISYRLEQALGHVAENRTYKPYKFPYLEKLECPEGVATAEGIQKALRILLDRLCTRLEAEENGLRFAEFVGHRLDGQVQMISIGTSNCVRNRERLYKLFENKISLIEPALGIEVFELRATGINFLNEKQSSLAENDAVGAMDALPPLLDRLNNKNLQLRLGRYIPLPNHLPERACEWDIAITDPIKNEWLPDQVRPIRLLETPQRISVQTVLPDGAPAQFNHRGEWHRIKKADGPEQIDPEWWRQSGQSRQYYRVEDHRGSRFWVFKTDRAGISPSTDWYLHGFLA